VRHGEASCLGGLGVIVQVLPPTLEQVFDYRSAMTQVVQAEIRIRTEEWGLSEA
jgi:hypothetical protein